MSSPEEDRPLYGGFTSLELGLLIGGVGLALLILIIIVNICIYRRRRPHRRGLYEKDDEDRMVNTRTDRMVDGKMMTQVIMKSQPNGNMDVQQQQGMPYQTMDPDTNTVTYHTAHQSVKREQTPEPVTVAFHQTDGTTTKVVTDVEVDSGTGASPVRRTSVDIHDESGPGEEDNVAFNDDEPSEEIPYTVSIPIQPVAPVPPAPRTPTPPPLEDTPPPPPPVTVPPPSQPKVKVTDLDADSDSGIPAPPPLPPSLSISVNEDDVVYAKINKNRVSTVRASEEAVPEPSSSGMSENSLRRSVWRPEEEIQIIEREKF